MIDPKQLISNWKSIGISAHSVAVAKVHLWEVFFFVLFCIHYERFCSLVLLEVIFLSESIPPSSNNCTFHLSLLFFNDVGKLIPLVVYLVSLTQH